MKMKIWRICRNGDKIYSITISSKCYIVDEITGEIQDYSFEDMDEYQTYEYFEDEEKMIICITENINKQLDKGGLGGINIRENSGVVI